MSERRPRHKGPSGGAVENAGPGGGGARRALLPAVIVILAGAFALMARSEGAGVETASLRRGELVIKLDAAGELDAVRSSMIGPPRVPGTWTLKISFMAPESSEVRKGEPVLGFDASDLQEEMQERQVEYDAAVQEMEKKRADLAVTLADLEIQLAEAESRLRKAELKADRPEELSGLLELNLARLDREIARKEVESLRRRAQMSRRAAEIDIESYAGKRDRAAARIEEIKDSIAKLTVPAPQDGIVVYRTDWQGNKRKIGDSVWIFDQVLKIPNLEEMFCQVEVDEAEAGRLEEGQRATIRLDTFPDEEFEGQVAEIDPVVIRKRGNTPLKVYKAKIALDSTDQRRMRPGMRARAAIEVERVHDALLVPREAVQLGPRGPALFVRQGRSFARAPVRTGRRNSRFVEIVEGASEGDLVALEDPFDDAPEPGAASGRPGS